MKPFLFLAVLGLFVIASAKTFVTFGDRPYEEIRAELDAFSGHHRRSASFRRRPKVELQNPKGFMGFLLGWRKPRRAAAYLNPTATTKKPRKPRLRYGLVWPPKGYRNPTKFSNGRNNEVPWTRSEADLQYEAAERQWREDNRRLQLGKIRNPNRKVTYEEQFYLPQYVDWAE